MTAYLSRRAAINFELLIQGLLFLFRKLETDIGAGAKAHQPQKRGAEFGHSQTVVDRRNKNNPQHNRPGKNLKTMKTIATGVSKNVLEKAA